MSENDEGRDPNTGRFLPGYRQAGAGQKGNQYTLRHGADRYLQDETLPAEMQGFDRRLATELLDHAGGDPAHQLLAQSAARRATVLELAYAWLAREDINLLWIVEEDGQKVVKWQPILNRLSTYHEGLRRDLDALGLTPAARARLGVGEKDTLDYDELVEELKNAKD